ncbi:DNA-binding GntR family transcriptional regulator [Deinobacterium chartae]|uniref:DNA-binding GntR family transcriptional regulator n=1 Tax=Deinobacterium chartae TaxID=521158 RepID=A0A841HVX4_9DEIO|nr:GntR family transcriptional regulator [Deinobacterium chartae]MBB6097066.1 DNA-binding GntR family transcriptional regulator [Deinobacterium chartae]
MFERPNLIRDEVYQHLRRAVLEGDYLPGTRLGETEIGERFGVSRTPIREALQRLVQEGLLEASANKGVRVRTVTPLEARESYAVREVLDGLAAALAARHHTEADAAQLRAALLALEAAEGDYREQTRLDLAFHRAVSQAAHNRILAEQLAGLERTVSLIKHLTRTYNAAPETREQHRAILEAVLARDEDAAREQAQQHVRTFAALVSAQLAHTSSDEN